MKRFILSGLVGSTISDAAVIINETFDGILGAS